MASEIQKVAERVRSIAADMNSWSATLARQSQACRGLAQRARALQHRYRGNPATLSALIAQLDLAARECEQSAEVSARLAPMLLAFANWLARIGEPDWADTRPAGVTSGSGLPPVEPEPPSPASAPRLWPAEDTTGHDIPEHIQRIAAELPEWTVGQRAAAQVLGPDGRPLLDSRDPAGDGGKTWHSGRIRDAGRGLRYPWRVSSSPRDHVEGHIAWRIRTDNTLHGQQITVTINKPPCNVTPVDCVPMLPGLLPSGTTVRIYVKQGDTVQWFGDCQGTGEGIEA